MKLVIEKIYCLYCPAFPLRGKVGISGNVEQRRASIEYEIRQKHGQHIRVKCLLKMPIITSAYTFEQALHAAFDRLYFPCKTMRGTNGGSEWWWSVNWVACILAYLVGYAYGWQPLCRQAKDDARRPHRHSPYRLRLRRRQLYLHRNLVAGRPDSQRHLCLYLRSRQGLEVER